MVYADVCTHLRKHCSSPNDRNETIHVSCVSVHLDAVWKLGPKLDMMSVNLFSQCRHIGCACDSCRSRPAGISACAQASAVYELQISSQIPNVHHPDLQVHQSEDWDALRPCRGFRCGHNKPSLLLVWGHRQHSFPHAKLLPWQQDSDEPRCSSLGYEAGLKAQVSHCG